MIRVWDLSGNQLALFKGHQDAIYSLSFSPDGQRLASAGKDGTVRLWSVYSVQQLAQLDISQHFDRGWVTGISFSPNNQAIAIAISFQKKTCLPKAQYGYGRLAVYLSLLLGAAAGLNFIA
jgi:WD40 repeat protein